MSVGAGSAVALALGAFVSAASLQSGSNNAKATLIGFEEVPSISTTGTGAIDLKIDDATETITFELSYENLEGVGTTPFVTNGVVTGAHIHLGAPGNNGGIAAHLCGGGGKPACPLSGTVTGVISAADITGPATQGINPGEPTAFAELARAIRAGYTYANVHSTRWPGGEIRGQIK
jgi:hypothetical protein